MNVINIDRAPRVFHGIYRRRLSAANEAVRRLRALGVRALAVRIPEGGAEGEAEIVVDRNPHCRIDGVHVTVKLLKGE